MPGEPTQLVSFRVTAQGIIPKLELRKDRPSETERMPLRASVIGRSISMRRLPFATPVYDRLQSSTGGSNQGACRHRTDGFDNPDLSGRSCRD